MLSFRTKILLSAFFVFILLAAILYLKTQSTVETIVFRAMSNRASEVIALIQSASDDKALVEKLRQQEPMVFFRLSVVNNERQVLYDSYTARLSKNVPDTLSDPEILDALEQDSGMREAYSEVLGQRLIYVAKAFDFHGKKYALRLAFPFKYVSELVEDFQIEFFYLLTAIFLIFGLILWAIISHFSRPIHNIIETVRHYQQGNTIQLPYIDASHWNKHDDSRLLADTLNNLSRQIQEQIDTLTVERNEKESLLEALIEGVVAVDSHMSITYLNRIAEKLLGIPKAQLIGHPFSITGQGECEELLTTCQKEKSVQTKTIQMSMDGRKIFLDLVAAPTSQQGAAILVMQDQSIYHKMLAMRKDFVANASHELKTPITIIRGFAETLHENADLPRETVMSITEKISRSCQRMTNIIKDLLTLADIENIPRSRLERCQLNEIIERCRQHVLEAFPDAVILIENRSGDDIELTAEPIFLELALSNLIENAAKYSSPPAHITISTERLNSHIRISVADKGMGIPAEDLEHIFQRFYTVNKALSKKMGGSGLGLSIVETIVEKHFGKITVTSEVGKGSTFTLLLPAEMERYYPSEDA